MTRAMLHLEVMLMLAMDLQKELREQGLHAHATEMDQAVTWLGNMLKELENA